MRNNFYVDNFLKSAATEKKVDEVVGELPVLSACGGFRLTKWVSSENSIMRHVLTSERASTVDLKLERLPTERTVS